MIENAVGGILAAMVIALAVAGWRWVRRKPLRCRLGRHGWGPYSVWPGWTSADRYKCRRCGRLA